MPRDHNSPAILIAEDDPNTAALVATYLQREGFATLIAADGIQALQLAREQQPGFIILDVMLPRMDGWEICRELRKFSDVPILFLTAREEEIDRILGLSLGADDYVVKPFSPRELVERVKAILRRVHKAKPADSSILTAGRLTLNPTAHRVTLGSEQIELTAAEFRLLRILMQASGKLFTREELLQRFCQHGESVIDKVIDVHIGKLRQKLGDDPAQPHFIETVRGFGYRFIGGES
jgi:DNA-binding response OmpR family regulator